MLVHCTVSPSLSLRGGRKGLFCIKKKAYYPRKFVPVKASSMSWQRTCRAQSSSYSLTMSRGKEAAKPPNNPTTDEPNELHVLNGAQIGES